MGDHQPFLLTQKFGIHDGPWEHTCCFGGVVGTVTFQKGMLRAGLGEGAHLISQPSNGWRTFHSQTQDTVTHTFQGINL